MILAVAAFAVGVVTGAYSHKWLAKETGAPANITVPSLKAEASAIVQDVAKKV